MTCDAFLETAWNDHGDRPQEVADRLACSLHVVESPEHSPPFARLVMHVYGEHLGEWDRGIALLESLRRLPASAGSGAAAGALDRNIATLRYAGGDTSVLESLSTEDRISVLALAASAFSGRNGMKRAIATYTEALALAGAGLPPQSPALRALAVGGNNLAAALEEKTDRDDAETEGMVVAAHGGLQYWKLAGTWLEEERAEYRLTRSLLQAGRPSEAIASAQRCIDVCARNDAPAIETFFGYVVLALAQRAGGDATAFAESRQQALARYEEVPADEQRWCRSDLSDLGD
jgi:tetratricopeptide (TPR) repeat protein